MQPPILRITTDPNAVVEAARPIFASGGIVVYPTETYYGLGTSALSEKALAGLIAAKGRDDRKPIPIIAAERSQVEAVAKIPPELARLADVFWPGPLTLALVPLMEFPAPIAAGSSTIGIRVSSDPLARALAEVAGGFLTATSANLSGRPPVNDARRLDPVLLDHVSVVIDMGPTPGGYPSTVVAERNGRIAVLRTGAIAVAQLTEVLGYEPTVVG
jgi:L-threonylcarbamoyladenylate synthase